MGFLISGTRLCLLMMQPLPNLTTHLPWILARDLGERRGQNRGERGLYPYSPGTSRLRENTGKEETEREHGRTEVWGGQEQEGLESCQRMSVWRTPQFPSSGHAGREWAMPSPMVGAAQEPGTG